MLQTRGLGSWGLGLRRVAGEGGIVWYGSSSCLLVIKVLLGDQTKGLGSLKVKDSEVMRIYSSDSSQLCIASLLAMTF
jgi:hypothetical protein